MSIQIPEEILNQWCDEFSTWKGECKYSPIAKIAYLAAKTSSYEQIELLKDHQRNNSHWKKVAIDLTDKEIPKLQERIKSQDEFIEKMNSGNPHKYCDQANADLESQLAKRDQLIEQAKPWAVEVFNLEMEDFDLKEKIDQWIKEVEELKEGK